MTRPSLKEFLRVLVSEWPSRVSGGLSVPFTLLALYFGNQYAKALFAVLAVLALLVAVYSVWANERRQLLVELQKTTASELQKREIDLRTAREQLVKLERENRRAEEIRKLDELDERVLLCVKQTFEYLTRIGSRPGSLNPVFQHEWAANAAKELGVETQAVKDSLVRLSEAKKLNSLGW